MGRLPSFSAPFGLRGVLQRTLWDGMAALWTAGRQEDMIAVGASIIDDPFRGDEPRMDRPFGGGNDHGPPDIACCHCYLSCGVYAAGARAEVLIGLAGPMTGKNAWFGEEMQRGAELAVADINAAGGVLGQQVRLIMADDFCDPEQAVAAARKLVSDGAIFVVGHYCSHSSIPASEIYQAAGVLMISPASSNPMLTELGRTNIFRVQTRDDAVGIVAGNYLADHWPDKKIAILHDDTIFGKGVAELTKRQLNRRGLTEAIYQAYVPGKADYGAEITGLQAAEIAVASLADTTPRSR